MGKSRSAQAQNDAVRAENNVLCSKNKEHVFTSKTFTNSAFQIEYYSKTIVICLNYVSLEAK